MITKLDLDAVGFHGSTTVIKEISCPSCKVKISAHTGYGLPFIGDLSLCAECGVLLEFDKDLNLMFPTQKTLDSLTPEELLGIQHSQEVVAKLKKRSE